jgi:hypothetical protein
MRDLFIASALEGVLMVMGQIFVRERGYAAAHSCYIIRGQVDRGLSSVCGVERGDGIGIAASGRQSWAIAAAHPQAVRDCREQERRDKDDTAVMQAARQRSRVELSQGK